MTDAPFLPALHNLALETINKDVFEMEVPGITGKEKRPKGLTFARTWATKKEPNISVAAPDPYLTDSNGIPHFLDEI